MIRRRELFGDRRRLAGDRAVDAAELADAAEADHEPDRPAEAADRIEASRVSRASVLDGRLLRAAPRSISRAQQDFTMGSGGAGPADPRAASMNAFDRLLESRGHRPGDADLGGRVPDPSIMKDPAINIASKTRIANQQVTWKTLGDYFHANADRYLPEMEAADKAGPGALVLAAGDDVPEYTRHEIHIQPGGYVGDPFAGARVPLRHQQLLHQRPRPQRAGPDPQGRRRGMPPADGADAGEVKRILDMGCGIGQVHGGAEGALPGRRGLGHRRRRRRWCAMRTCAPNAPRHRRQLRAEARRGHRLPGRSLRHRRPATSCTTRSATFITPLAIIAEARA